MSIFHSLVLGLFVVYMRIHIENITMPILLFYTGYMTNTQIEYGKMKILESTGTFGFHGTPVLPQWLTNYQDVEPGSLMPLNTPRNLNTTTELHMPRTSDRLAQVSFYDMLAPATLRGLLHANNHSTLAPVDCLSGFELDEEGLHLQATQALLDDTYARSQSIKAAVFATPLKNLRQSPDQQHDYWSSRPVLAEYVAIVDGTYLEHLAGQCATGMIKIVAPFQPNFNNC